MQICKLSLPTVEVEAEAEADNRDIKLSELQLVSNVIKLN